MFSRFILALRDRGLSGVFLNFIPLAVIQANTLEMVNAFSGLVLNGLTAISILVVIILNLKKIFNKDEK